MLRALLEEEKKNNSTKMPESRNLKSCEDHVCIVQGKLIMSLFERTCLCASAFCVCVHFVLN